MTRQRREEWKVALLVLAGAALMLAVMVYQTAGNYGGGI
jgi:hypothetical protein